MADRQNHKKQYQALTVAAAIIFAAAFQAGANPRGGFYGPGEPNKAGKAVWKDLQPETYKIFSTAVIISMASALLIIVLDVSGLQFTSHLLIWIFRMVMYICSLSVMTCFVALAEPDTVSSVYIIHGFTHCVEILIFVSTSMFVINRIENRHVIWKIFIGALLVLICIAGAILCQNLSPHINNDTFYNWSPKLYAGVGTGYVFMLLYLIVDYVIELVQYVTTQLGKIICAQRAEDRKGRNHIIIL